MGWICLTLFTSHLYEIQAVRVIPHQVKIDCLPAPFLYPCQTIRISAHGRLRDLRAELNEQGKGLVFLCAVSLIAEPDMVQNGSRYRIVSS